MKIVSIIRQVPDAEARIRAAGDQVDLSGVSFILDGMDEYGVEEALRLREAGVASHVTVMAVGPARSEDAVRTALAMGADDAILLETGDDPDPLTTARALAGPIRESGASLVFTGGKQADWDSAALGAALAELLGWNYSDWTTSVTVEGDRVSVRHDTDSGSERLDFSLPAVITTQQGLNEPRYPTLPNIMKSRKKPLDVKPFGEGAAPVRVTARTIELRERRGEVIGGDAATAARELVRKLREEARVLA